MTGPSDNHEPVELPPEIAEESTRYISARFRGVKDMHPYMATLKRVAIDHLAACMMKGAKLPLQNISGRPAGSYGAADMPEHISRVGLGPWEAVEKKVKLPSLPTVIIKLQQCIEDPDHTAEDISKIVGLDPKLSAALLSLVNSAMFGMPRQVDSIPRAVTIAGSKQISMLALSVVLMNMFEDAPLEALNMDSFWRHSIACAVVAHAIAIQGHKMNPERFFLAGLLHDIGRIAMATSEPELYSRCLTLAESKGIPLEQAEKDLFGFDHCMVGGMLLKKWNLPDSLVHAALFHHSMHHCIGNEFAEVVQIANAIAVAMGYSCLEDDVVGETLEQAWENSGLDPQTIESLLEGLDTRLTEVMSALS